MQLNINKNYKTFIEAVVNSRGVPARLAFDEVEGVVTSIDPSGQFVFSYNLLNDTYTLSDGSTGKYDPSKKHIIVSKFEPVNKFDMLSIHIINAIPNFMFHNIKSKALNGNIYYNMRFTSVGDEFTLVCPFGDIKFTYIGANLLKSTEVLTIPFENDFSDKDKLLHHAMKIYHLIVQTF